MILIFFFTTHIFSFFYGEHEVFLYNSSINPLLASFASRVKFLEDGATPIVPTSLLDVGYASGALKLGEAAFFSQGKSQGGLSRELPALPISGGMASRRGGPTACHRGTAQWLTVPHLLYSPLPFFLKHLRVTDIMTPHSK